MVIVQHFCETSMLGGLEIIKNNNDTVGFAFFSFIYCIARVAVNIFILISGYFSIESYNRPIGKPLTFFFMATGYGVFSFFIRCLSGVRLFDIKGLIVAAIPKNYYVSLFSVLYLISPYINWEINRLKERTYRELLLLSFLLFSVWSTASNIMASVYEMDWVGIYSISMNGTDGGFSIVNFVLLYIVGGYIRKNCKIILGIRKIYYIIGFFGIATLNAAIKLTGARISDVLLGYDSVMIIVQAVCLFCLFLKIEIKNNKIINAFAERVFGVFLVHYIVIKSIARVFNIEKWLSRGILSSTLFLVITIVLGVLISAVIDLIFHKILNPISRKWKKTKVYNICLNDSLLEEC